MVGVWGCRKERRKGKGKKEKEGVKRRGQEEGEEGREEERKERKKEERRPGERREPRMEEGSGKASGAGQNPQEQAREEWRKEGGPEPPSLSLRILMCSGVRSLCSRKSDAGGDPGPRPLRVLPTRCSRGLGGLLGVLRLSPC